MAICDLYPAIDLRGGRVVRLTRGDYAAETVEIQSQIFGECLNALQEIGSAGPAEQKLQGPLALRLFDFLVTNVDLDPKSATLAVNLFNLAKKGGNADKAHAANSLRHLQKQQSRGKIYFDLHLKLAS